MTPNEYYTLQDFCAVKTYRILLQAANIKKLDLLFTEFRKCKILQQSCYNLFALKNSNQNLDGKYKISF